MDEVRLQKLFLEYVKSDESAYDLVKANQVFLREVWERGYRSGHAEGVASVNRRERPDPEAA